MNQIDIPDMIAGALGVSRGTAYDMMREALAEQPVVTQQLTTGYVCVVCKDAGEMETGIGMMACDACPPALAEQPALRKPLTDEMVVAAARMLSDRQAAACNVDCGDMWKLHGNDFLEDAHAALEAAYGIKEQK